jgi:hypothetical protein
MEELHTNSIDGGREASYGLGHVTGRGRTPTTIPSVNEMTIIATGIIDGGVALR